MATYSHHHVAHAHHSGLVVGVVTGSLAVTTVLAIGLVTLNPKFILHPLSTASKISIQDTSSSNQPSTPLGSIGARAVQLNTGVGSGAAAQVGQSL